MSETTTSTTHDRPATASKREAKDARDTAEQRSPLKSPQRGDIIAILLNDHPDLPAYEQREELYTVVLIDDSDLVHARTQTGSDYIIPLAQWEQFAASARVVHQHTETRPLMAPGLDRAACAEERERERVGQGRHAPVPNPVTGLSPRNEPADKDDPRAQAVPGTSGSHRDPHPIPPRDKDPQATGSPDHAESRPREGAPQSGRAVMPDRVDPKPEGAPGPAGADSPAGLAAQHQHTSKAGRPGTSDTDDDTKTAEHSKSPQKDDKAKK